ncbi:MAG TPA: TonB family protein, partial [Bacteroidales bacterium]|nr:TonB family protein [Bacteroidales bacterium]
MNKLFEYSIESAISLAVFYLFYRIFMSKSTHFRLNRFILMFSVIISMVLPALANRIDMPAAGTLNLAIDFSTPESLPSTATSLTQSANAETGYSLLEIIGLIYIAGAAIILARLGYQAIYLHAVSRLSKTSDYKGYKIISLDTDMVPFAYFNRIFIPADRINENSLESVIMHEQSHLTQGHNIDLFILQIITVLQWFNPFVWLFEKSLKEIHEYLADEAVLESGKDKGNYQAILVNEALGGPVFILTNQFNKSLIKKRILMMKNVKSSKIVQLKALLVVPLLVGLLLAFANPPLISQTGDKDLIVKGNVSDRFSGKPIAGAVVLIKGTTTGTITDDQGNYELIVSGPGDVLIVSITGFRTQETAVGNMGKNSNLNFLLEQDILTIDFNQGNKLALEDRSVQDHPKKSDSDGNFVLVEELPAYPGGTLALYKFIQDNLQYPYEAKTAGLAGTVLVIYTINTNGEVTDPKIIRGIQFDMDKEALRVTKLIKGWKPASQNGRPVSTTVTMPVEF